MFISIRRSCSRLALAFKAWQDAAGRCRGSWGGWFWVGRDIHGVRPCGNAGAFVTKYAPSHECICRHVHATSLFSVASEMSAVASDERRQSVPTHPRCTVALGARMIYIIAVAVAVAVAVAR